MLVLRLRPKMLSANQSGIFFNFNTSWLARYLTLSFRVRHTSMKETDRAYYSNMDMPEDALSQSDWSIL